MRSPIWVIIQTAISPSLAGTVKNSAFNDLGLGAGLFLQVIQLPLQPGQLHLLAQHNGYSHGLEDHWICGVTAGGSVASAGIHQHLKRLAFLAAEGSGKALPPLNLAFQGDSI
jgi:hypothetical protein